MLSSRMISQPSATINYGETRAIANVSNSRGIIKNIILKTSRIMTTKIEIDGEIFLPLDSIVNWAIYLTGWSNRPMFDKNGGYLYHNSPPIDSGWSTTSTGQVLIPTSNNNILISGNINDDTATLAWMDANLPFKDSFKIEIKSRTSNQTDANSSRNFKGGSILYLLDEE